MNSKPRIKNLIFDLGGVIILAERVNFSKFNKEFSLRRGTIEKIVKTCFNKKMIDKNFDERLFFKENFSRFLSWLDYQKILEKIHRTERVNKSLLNWIKKKKREYKIFLLTNNTVALNHLLKEKFKIKNFFDLVFNSAKIGLAKPDSKLFEYLLEKIGASSKECLFVDDNPKNIKSARNIGFLAILFKNNKEFLARIQELRI